MSRIPLLLVAVGLAAIAPAQRWSTTYEDGIKAASAGKWMEARRSFFAASADRADESGPIFLPGPITERRKWRNGAPYSPLYLAAFSGVRQAETLTGAELTTLLTTVAGELEGLLAKGQRAASTVDLLTQVYTKLNDSAKLADLRARVTQTPVNSWRVDVDSIGASSGTPSSNGTGNTVKPPGPGNQTPPTTPNPTGIVPYVAEKYALIIGNTVSAIEGGGLAYASDDAQRIHDAITTFAGYDPKNVSVVQNGTVAQMTTAAQALASRVTDGGTVMIFFSGVGSNLGGRDFLAGVETAGLTGSAGMLAKQDLYQYFMSRGAKVFAFFQANRPISDGHIFGSEIPVVGSIAQVQATMPGDMVYGITSGGKATGLFTSAMVSVLTEYKTNQLPIFEFGWQIFNKVRSGGAAGVTSGSSRQTPTLPVLSNLASDARF